MRPSDANKRISEISRELDLCSRSAAYGADDIRTLGRFGQAADLDPLSQRLDRLSRQVQSLTEPTMTDEEILSALELP